MTFIVKWQVLGELMESLVLSLVYSGLAQAGGAEDDQCMKTDVVGVGLSESTCGNGKSDLYKFIEAWISGRPLPISSGTSTFGATVWAQDLVGNGYEVNIAKGTLNRENSVTEQSQELFNVSPGMIVDGVIDFEDKTGWVIDKIWSASWAGSVMDEKGKSTMKPALHIDGTNIVLTPPGGVYGCLKIKYELTVDKLTVENDGEGDDSVDPFSTSLSFDVDGCDDEELLDLPSKSCLLESLGNPWDGDPYLSDVTINDDDDDDDDIPKESPQDTERVWDYCTKKFKSASPASLEPADPENSYFGVTPHFCDGPFEKE